MANTAETKANRLLQIEALLLSHPEGLKPAELARRLGVHRSTIGRYLYDLPKHIYLDDEDGGRWKIDRAGYLIQVRFNLHEATAVHLAARLLAARMDRQNPHAAAALRKLSASMEMIAPHISRHLSQSADEMDGERQIRDPRFVENLEQMTLAWAYGRKLRVWHRYSEDGEVYEYLFSPYFVEPYAVGQSVHVFGLREPPGALRTFKLDRIERVELLSESYSIPADFNPQDLLADAWGIWYTDHEPEQVKLKFSPQVARRVGESRWHQSEQTVIRPDGSLLWCAKIAAPKEMLPWIRGWGADVEVLEPEWLREVLVQEARKAALLYGWEVIN